MTAEVRRFVMLDKNGIDNRFILCYYVNMINFNLIRGR